MKIIKNNIIPFRGFCAITFWPFIFVRKDRVERLVKRGKWDIMVNHESIHGEQQKEMLCAGVAVAALLLMAGCLWWSLLALPLFFWWYLAEWFVRLFMRGSAYRNISFEREAYENEDDAAYIGQRKPFAWLRWMLK